MSNNKRQALTIKIEWCMNALPARNRAIKWNKSNVKAADVYTLEKKEEKELNIQP